MFIQVLIFVAALTGLLFSARFFTSAAEQIGAYLRMPSFVIGVLIVGVGTSLPELISSVLSVKQQVSEIVPGNIIGANITNLLLITGLVSYLNGREISLSKSYIFIDLHYLVGAAVMFVTIAYDGKIQALEAAIGLLAYVVYTLFLIKENAEDAPGAAVAGAGMPWKSIAMLLVSGIGIYLGADYTVSSISAIAAALLIPPSVIALTVLSLGTTLPELAVNISAIRSGKAEMAIGNVLGSCIFNAMVVPGVAAWFGAIDVPPVLLGFSLPFMLGAVLFFYLLTQDKKLSRWEGILFMLIYGLFLIKTAGLG
jgi:cation:H+ antiporter